MYGSEGRSFATGVKDELIRLPLGKSCCLLSELSALTQTLGHLTFRGAGRLGVTYRVDHAGIARRLFQLLKKQLNLSPTLHFSQSTPQDGHKTCVLTLDDEDSKVLLTALHMMETDEDGQLHLKRTTPRHPMTRQCCRRAFFRGAFLGAGTVNNPEKGYHFEWKSDDDALPLTLERLLYKCDLPYHCYERKGKKVVYLKGAQQIADILTMMGATQTVLELEDTRIKKQIRASAARATNCDEHNSEKMLDAAQRQAEAIRTITLKRGLFTLPPALREVAKLRREHTELSLTEIGQMMDPPVGKSGINHRMRRLMEIAEEIERESELEEQEKAGQGEMRS